MEKLALFCHVSPNNILNLIGVSNIWRAIDYGGTESTLGHSRPLANETETVKLESWKHRAEKWDSVHVPCSSGGWEVHWFGRFVFIGHDLTDALGDCVR